MREYRIRRPLIPCLLLLASYLIAPAAGICTDVLTYHNDNAQTGQNVNETTLTPKNVNAEQFGLLFTQPLDGLGWHVAQALYAANVRIPGKGIHNVVYVATTHDEVFAFDADSNQAANATPLWRTSFVNVSAGITPQPDLDELYISFGDIGITATPVIDRSTDTMYVEVATKEVRGGVDTFFQRLHALDIATGLEKNGSPVVIRGSTPGTGDGSVSGVVSFNPRQQRCRPGLVLHNGKIFMGFGSIGDDPPYHGWLFVYDAATLHQDYVLDVTPDGWGGGIWNSGAGVAFDDAGSLYVATGNGTFDVPYGGRDYGDCLIKLVPSGQSYEIADYFSPYDQDRLLGWDYDLCAGGTIILPDQPGPHPHVLAQVGKEGTIYLIDRDNLGQFNTGYDNVLQSVTGILGETICPGAYHDNMLYYEGIGGDETHKQIGSPARGFLLNDGQLSLATQSDHYYPYPMDTPSVSANGARNGILWTVDPEGPTLIAYDDRDLSKVLYSTQAMGKVGEFSPPTIANGKVYIVATNSLAVFGLLPPPLSTARSQPVSAGLTALAAADFDVNSKPDLATNAGSLLLGGNILGNYSDEGKSVVAGDFNSDGRPDLVLGEQYHDLPAVDGDILFGNGDATFQAPHQWGKNGGLGFSGAGVVASGDFNRDGQPDLVACEVKSVAGQNKPFLSVFTGRGDGTFSNTYSGSSGVQPGAVAVGDFNGDGMADSAAVSSDRGGVLTVQLGNGDGTLAAPQTSVIGGTPSSLVVGDFDRDRKLDVAYADAAGNSISVLLGNSDGTFAAPVQILSGPDPEAIAAGYVNQDQILDLVSANGMSDQACIMLGKGDGAFEAPFYVDVGSNPRGIFVEDLNQDGAPDIATANSGDNTVSILFNGRRTQVILSTSVNPALPSQPVVLRAAVTSAVPNVTSVSTGFVTFLDGSTIIGTKAISSGAADLSISGLSVGNHKITAAYSGSTRFEAAKSKPILQQVLPNPTALYAVPQDKQIALHWTPPSGAESCNVKRSPVNGGSYVTIASNLKGADYLDRNLTNGVPYYYVVTALSEFGESQPSNQASGIPSNLDPIQAPTELSGSASFNRVSLRYTCRGNTQTGYMILRKFGELGAFTLLANVSSSALTYEDTTVSGASLYTYEVKATNAGGESAVSNRLVIATPPHPPAAPSRLAASAYVPYFVNLTWNSNSNNQSEFRIFRRSGISPYKAIGSVAASSLSFRDTSFDRGVQYFYSVSASNAGGDSPLSNEVAVAISEAPPSAPTNLRITAMSRSTVDLVWNYSGNSQAGFGILRSTTGTSFRLIGTAAATEFTFQDTSFNADSNYIYLVYAENSGGQSPPSNPISILTPIEPPAAPIKLTATAGPNLTVRLTWSFGGNNQTSFKILRKTGPSIFGQVGTTSGASFDFTDASLSAETVYTYEVVAANRGGDSVPSNSVKVQTLAAPPAAPKNVTAKADAPGRIDLSWIIGSSDQTGFIVFRKTSGAEFQVAASLKGTVTIFTDQTNVVPGISYTYRVVAKNAGGDSPPSNVVSVTAQ